jgi:CAAX protease family protein
MQQQCASGQTGGVSGRVVHGFMFFLVLACTTSVPALANWPWHWLAPWLPPLLGYGAILLCNPPLRRSFGWLRFGRVSGRLGAATLLTIVAFVTLLSMIPESHFPTALADTLPFRAHCHIRISCALFAVINGTVQELVFRGLLFDSLESVWPRRVAVFVSALIFGIIHLPVLPPSFTGILVASAAADLGVVLACLRLWSGGLALPIIVHIAVDSAIIYRAIHGAV